MTRWYTRPIVPVSDVHVALGFYIGQLGFTEDWRYEEDRLLIAQVNRAGCELILSSQWPDKIGQSLIFVSLDVEVLTALRHDLDQCGVTVRDGNWGYRLMVLDDPDGNQLMFPYPADTEKVHSND